MRPPCAPRYGGCFFTLLYQKRYYKKYVLLSSSKAHHFCHAPNKTGMMKGLVLEGVEASELLDRFNALETQISALRDGMEPKRPAEYLTRREVATLFKVSLPTVHDWTRKGILSAYRIGNRVFYKRVEVEAAATPVAQ